jgi:rhamnosyl/mannosyltransferase
MVYGKPVINTLLDTAVPRVSIDGETGITVPPEDETALTGAIQRLVDDKALREKLGENAKVRCRRFSLENMEGRLVLSYEKLLGRKLHKGWSKRCETKALGIKKA